MSARALAHGCPWRVLGIVRAVGDDDGSSFRYAFGERGLALCEMGKRKPNKERTTAGSKACAGDSDGDVEARRRYICASGVVPQRSKSVATREKLGMHLKGI